MKELFQEVCVWTGVEVKETNEAGDEQGWVTSLGPDARQRRLIEEPGG